MPGWGWRALISHKLPRASRSQVLVKVSFLTSCPGITFRMLMCRFLLSARPAEFLRVGTGNLIFKEESRTTFLLTKPELLLQISTVVHVTLTD